MGGIGTKNNCREMNGVEEISAYTRQSPRRIRYPSIEMARREVLACLRDEVLGAGVVSDITGLIIRYHCLWSQEVAAGFHHREGIVVT